MKYMKISDALDLKIAMFDESKDSLDGWSKQFSLKVIHKGLQKLVSNSQSTSNSMMLSTALTENCTQSCMAEYRCSAGS